MNEQDIIELVKNDEWMMSVLKEAEKLNLPDWMIGAGFLRNKVWDYLHGFKKEISDTRDIDLIYFNDENQNEKADEELSLKMQGKLGLEWEIVNQAYTHKWHNREEPYADSSEALSEWVETATCVAVTLKNCEPEIIAPHGLSDLVGLIVRPTLSHKNNLELFHNRVQSKNWLNKWPKLKVVVE
ncbi:MAG: nucleotidyltransferase family protein [Candidatus Pacebacteria bacterium]|nr:nucleotidyltransferase family protein [Candidatus Paceibacterota bacterium]